MYNCDVRIEAKHNLSYICSITNFTSAILAPCFHRRIPSNILSSIIRAYRTKPSSSSFDTILGHRRSRPRTARPPIGPSWQASLCSTTSPLLTSRMDLFTNTQHTMLMALMWSHFGRPWRPHTRVPSLSMVQSDRYSKTFGRHRHTHSSCPLLLKFPTLRHGPVTPKH